MEMLDADLSEDGQLEAAGEPDVAAQQRTLVVRKLCDIVVLSASRISSNERSLAADVLIQMLDRVPTDIRREVAERAAQIPEAPTPLLSALMMDEPEIALPVIKNSDKLPASLLCDVAQNGTVTHRDAIARRPDLTSAVADALVEAAEPEVLKVLLRRDECELSTLAIDKLVARAVSDTEMQLLLLKRRELEPSHGFLMFWWLDAERRRRVLSRFAMNRSIIQDALEDLYAPVFREPGGDPLVKQILVMLERRHRPRGLNGEPVSMDVVIRTLKAARKYPAQEIVDAIGMIAGTSRELAARILRDPGVEPFAVMCKGLGVPREVFFEIISHQDADIPLSEERAEQVLEVFDAIARDFARAVLRYWDWDGNPRIANMIHLLGLSEEL